MINPMGLELLEILGIRGAAKQVVVGLIAVIFIAFLSFISYFLWTKYMNPPHEIDGIKYWYVKTVAVFETEPQINGNFFEFKLAGDDNKYRVHKAEVAHRENKEEAYKLVVAALLKRVPDEQGMTILKRITDRSFNDPAQWVEWYESNKDKLVLSKDGKRLVVRP